MLLLPLLVCERRCRCSSGQDAQARQEIEKGIETYNRPGASELDRSLAILVSCVARRKLEEKYSKTCNPQQAIGQLGGQYTIEDYMWHKLSVMECTDTALAELQKEINTHIGRFDKGLKE